MKFISKNSSSLLLLLLLVFPLFINNILISDLSEEENHQNNDKFSPIRLTQGISNISIQYTIPNLVWNEIQLTITVVSNKTGQLRYIFGEKGSQKYFDLVAINQTIVVGVNPPFEIKVKPLFFTLPGKYNLELVATLIGTGESFSGDIEIVLGFGYTVLFSILIIFGTAILVILTRKHEIDEDKIVSAQAAQHSGRAPEGKIPCPTCYKLIDEGLTFCPECGERIPEFLRFSPSSSSS
jgi:hypothetical protein